MGKCLRQTSWTLSARFFLHVMLVGSTSCFYLIHVSEAKSKVRPLYLSHRGAYGNASPCAANTFCAFDESLKRGFDGFECDVTLTRDRHLVISHGPALQESTTCSGEIAKRDLADLKAHCVVDKSNWNQASKQTEPMHDLRELLERYVQHPQAKKIYVDIKPGDPYQIWEALKAAIHGMEPSVVSRFVFEVDDVKTLNLLKERLPALPVFMSSFLKQGTISRYECNQVAALGLPDLPSLQENVEKVTTFIRQQKNRGRRVIGWTIDSQEQLTFAEDKLDLDMMLLDLPYPPRPVSK